MFHGVITKNIFEVRNYTKKHLLKNEFIKILQDLKKNGNCISMDDFYYYQSQSIPFNDKSFIITFDDGFYNNYKIAVPILKKFNFPSTFYLTTDFIDKNLTSWIDRIEIVVENTKHRVEIDTFWGKTRFNNTKKSKINFLNEVRKNVKKKLSIDPYKFADQIIKQIGYKKNYKNSNTILDKKMNWKIVKKYYEKKINR